MRLLLRLDRVTIFDVTLFEPADDDDELSDMTADTLPFGFIGPDVPYPDPSGNQEDDDDRRH